MYSILYYLYRWCQLNLKEPRSAKALSKFRRILTTSVVDDSVFCFVEVVVVVIAAVSFILVNVAVAVVVVVVVAAIFGDVAAVVAVVVAAVVAAVIAVVRSKISVVNRSWHR